jgi:peptidyl-prolyl cis-trans isomerase A (cyclophilin A)
MELAAGFEKNKRFVQFIQRGEGKQAVAGKTVSVHEGFLESGKVFDSSYPRKKIKFPLGQGNIEGWDEGILCAWG